MRALAVCLAILAAASAADNKALAGKYAGEWKSDSGKSGALHFTLEGPKKEIWHCDLSLVFEGVDVPAIVREIKVNEAQAKIDITYDFDAQRATRRTHITGEWDGAAFKGRYETTVGGAPADSGTWTAVRDQNP